MIDLMEKVETPEQYSFTAHDRCDASAMLSEQAYHRVAKNGQELFLCDHHYKKHKDALLVDGWMIESDVKALVDLGNPLDVSANA